MAGFRRSFRTEHVLDVSQDADSSPIPLEGRSQLLQVHEIIDRVEDSYPTAYQGDAVQRQRSNDNNENLYSVSPKPNANPTDGSRQPTATDVPVVTASRVHSLTSVVRSQEMAAAQGGPPIARQALDTLLAEGATVHLSRSQTSTSRVQGRKSAYGKPHNST